MGFYQQVFLLHEETEPGDRTWGLSITHMSRKEQIIMVVAVLTISNCLCGILEEYLLTEAHLNES